MARIDDIHEPERSFLLGLECPTFDTQPWAEGPPLSERRVALLTTAGLNRRDDRPFMPSARDYRVIPGDVPANELVVSHISTNWDRTGFQQDLNVVFPIDRLWELRDEGVIGSVADYHYSFMGATDPAQMEDAAREVGGLLKKDRVDAALLVPV